MLRRGWLTDYQAHELFAGRGRELLLGEYSVLEHLGEGSSSRVFKGRHRPSGRIVALKVLRGGLAAPEIVGRLRRSAAPAPAWSTPTSSRRSVPAGPRTLISW